MTLPLLECLALWMLWWSWRRGRAWRWFLGGVLLGMTPYTYTSSRLFPVVSGVFLIGQALIGREFIRGRVRGLLLAGVTAAVVFLPLVLHFSAHPEAITGRPAQVALPADPLTVEGIRALAINSARTVGMFFVAGDANWRHNLAGLPVFAPPFAVLFALG